MSESWGPSSLGAMFTSSPPWSFTIAEDQYRLAIGDRGSVGSLLDLENIQIKPGLIWSAVHLQARGGQEFDLDGIPNLKADRMCDAINMAINRLRHRQYVAKLMLRFDPAVTSLLAWQADTDRACQQQFQRRGWLDSEFRASVEAGKPSDFKELLLVTEIQQHLEKQELHIQQAVADWQLPFDRIAEDRNRQYKLRELSEERDFFDTVEKSPLTQEQIEAVVCFDNRVLLVASAGSGKTSTMVAKAGYALKKGYFAPEQILLLAFNSDAAKELAERVEKRLARLGLPRQGIAAKTFHAFGLEIVGKATGKKPSVAPWIDSGRDLDVLLELVNELKQSDLGFKVTWDMFRLVFGQDLPKLGAETDNPESWDRESGRSGFWTLNGEVVRSRGEAVLANWLFFNGVAYVYEGSYEHDRVLPRLHGQFGNG